MAEAKEAVDPFTAWRDWLGQAERQLNTFFNNVMGTDQYTRALGQFNDFSLNMQKSMGEAMGRYLSSLNLPTREDFAALGDRLASIEERLGTIERASGGLQPSVSEIQGPSNSPRPPRTRKPPKGKS